MSAFTPVGNVDDIPPGSGKQVLVGARAVALFNVDGSFHAIDGVCLHRGGPVGEGDLDGCIVTCPWHGWQYDVRDGRHTLDPDVGLTTHHVRVEDATILIALAD